jgi:hypothetical protein
MLCTELDEEQDFPIMNTILVLFHFDSKALISMIGELITKDEAKSYV